MVLEGRVACPPPGFSTIRAMLGFPQKSLHGPARRIRTRLLTWFGNQPPRTQGVYAVEVGGHKVKRVRMADSFEAESKAAHLRTFGPDGIYPSLILRKENELWVEYIEGEPIRTVDREVLEKLAALFAVLYRRDPVQVPSEKTHHNHELHVDLDFLRRVGVLTDPRHRELDAMVDRLTPAALWVGYDCTDAILKNFVVCPDGRIRGIDVESIGAAEPIGIGTAKASIRWLDSQRDLFLDALAKNSVPDFRPYMTFLELSFTAFWLKNSVLERKRHFVNPGLFDRFVA